MEYLIPVAKGVAEIDLLAQMANRHGLIAGATGTGKTVTLKVMAEGFSKIGVPVFMADVKGDLAGICQTGTDSPKIHERAEALGLKDLPFCAFPTAFWDVFGETGHPVRASVSEMGPLLLGRLLSLNETQNGVLNLIFRIADDAGLLLLDLKDLQAMVQHVGDNAKDYTTKYGNIAAASVGTIQRGLIALEEQGADKFFGEPALNLTDLMRVTGNLGTINILSAEKLMMTPKVYSTMLLWMLSELFESLPEAGDLEKPKLVFFFDEAHLLFDDAPKVLLEKIEQVVRLIRSKGVGVYFITQSPLDVPESVLGQLGNRVQHALRAFTPKDQKAVKAAAQTFRADGKLNVEKVISELGTGEALVSFLDAKGSPGVVERAMIYPPLSRIGAITPEERKNIIQHSPLFGHYEETQDRESAYEKLKSRAAQPANPQPSPAEAQPHGGLMQSFNDLFTGGSSSSGGSRQRQTPMEAAVKSAARSIGSQVGRQLVRGIMGSLLGGSSQRR